MAKSGVSLKLLIDTKNKKVMFAEAGKDFVDFLFTLLSLPISTVVRLLSKKAMVGTLGTLYHSVENLSDTYIQPNVSKDTILNPKIPLGLGSSTPSFLALTGSTTSTSSSVVAKKIYTCSEYYGSCSRQSVSDGLGAVCPTCGRKMSTALRYVAPPVAAQTAGQSSAEGGYVNSVMTYMIMDDLEVKPMSTISSISMLNKFKVKEVGALEERAVSLGMNEGLELLEASLHSKTVLTDVFMQIKKSTKKRAR